MQDSSWKSTKTYQWTSMTSMRAIDIKFFDSIFTSSPPLQFGIRQRSENEHNR